MNKIGIYSIKSPSGKIYIGMTCDSFENRWAGHLKELRSGRHKCRGLKRAYIKYGEESLCMEILESYEKPSSREELMLLHKTLLNREQFWWDTFKEKGITAYNGRPTGTGSVFHTEETRKAIGQSVRRISPEKRRKQVPFLQNCTECNIEILSSSNNRKYCSLECKYKGSYKNNTPQVCAEEFCTEMVYSRKRCLEHRVPKTRAKKVFNKKCGFSICNNLIEKTKKFCSSSCANKERYSSCASPKKEELVKLYLTERKSTTEISKMYGTSHTNVRKWLMESQIALRTRAEGVRIIKNGG